MILVKATAKQIKVKQKQWKKSKVHQHCQRWGRGLEKRKGIKGCGEFVCSGTDRGSIAKELDGKSNRNGKGKRNDISKLKSKCK